MKATSLLESQHKQIASLIEELERPGADRRDLSERLATVVLAHMVIEEEIFYPQAEKLQRELVQQGAEDHECGLPALERLVATPADDEHFAARLQVFKALLQAHVNKEEGILFPAVNRSFAAEKNVQLGRQMKLRFDHVVKAGHMAALKLRTAEAMKRAPGGIVGVGVAPSAAGQGAKKEKGQHGKEARAGSTGAQEAKGSQSAADAENEQGAREQAPESKE